MSRLVVLEFDDNEEAEKFVQELDKTVAYVDRIGEADGPVEGKVVGLFANPVNFCPGSGSGGCSTGKRVRGWAYGKKFGWWVCTVCKKPSDYRASGAPVWRSVISQGVNLLKPVEEHDPETVHDEGWGAYREWTNR